MRRDNKAPVKCSFCGKSRKEVKKLIAGLNAYICNECLGLSNDLIARDATTGPVAVKAGDDLGPTPRILSIGIKMRKEGTGEVESVTVDGHRFVPTRLAEVKIRNGEWSFWFGPDTCHMSSARRPADDRIVHTTKAGLEEFQAWIDVHMSAPCGAVPREVLDEFGSAMWARMKD